MSFGKMNTFIDIISTQTIKDSEGFAVTSDNILASIRAYKEDRHGNERWANMAAFSSASSLFQLRKIPGLEVTTDMVIVCDTGRYRILSVENIRGGEMFTEVLADKLEPSVR